MSNRFQVLLILVAFFVACKNAPPLPNETNFIIPSGFTIIPHDKESDEILSLNYQNEFMIIVSTNASKILKKGMMKGAGMMKMGFGIKFTRLMSKFNGLEKGDLKEEVINGNPYISQSFDYKTGDSKGYYTYGMMYISEPEMYYEFFITGDKSKLNKHEEMHKAFLDGVR